MTDSYKQEREHLRGEQEGMSKEAIVDLLKKKSDHVADLDNLPKQKHRWVDRGLVMSCEGGDHPNHRAFKRR